LALNTIFSTGTGKRKLGLEWIHRVWSGEIPPQRGQSQPHEVLDSEVSGGFDHLQFYLQSVSINGWIGA
jgi:hypothetical protein